VHRHIKIGDRVVSVPGYQVTSDEEKHNTAHRRYRNTKDSGAQAGDPAEGAPQGCTSTRSISGTSADGAAGSSDIDCQKKNF